MKALNKKRILSTALAGAMALSLAVPAFAAGEEGDDPPANTTVITGAYEEVEIEVVVPQTGTAQINPYALPVDVPLASDATTAAGTISGQQIVTQPLYIKNKTALKLAVGATVTGGTAGAFKFATSEEAITGREAAEGVTAVAAATTNSGFVYLQTKASTTAMAEDAEGGDPDLADALNTEFASWAASAYSATTDVVLGTKAVEKADFATLEAATMDDDSGAFDSYAAGSIVLYRLAGKVVEAPKTPWKEADGFTATVAFTFKPAAN